MWATGKRSPSSDQLEAIISMWAAYEAERINRSINSPHASSAARASFSNEYR